MQGKRDNTKRTNCDNKFHTTRPNRQEETRKQICLPCVNTENDYKQNCKNSEKIVIHVSLSYSDPVNETISLTFGRLNAHKQEDGI